LLDTKESLLADIEKVSSAKISEINSKIKEKEILILETENNFDNKIIKLEKIIEDNVI
jgi:hypothetical protein